jgi:hypothetical protein
MNGRPVPFHLAANEEDQHVMTKATPSAKASTLTIRVQNDFGVSYESALPALGMRSQELRMLSETWNASRDTLTADVTGVAGRDYELNVWNPSQTATVEGGELLGMANGTAKVRIRFPPGDSDEYLRGKIVFHFAVAQERKSKSAKAAH